MMEEDGQIPPVRIKYLLLHRFGERREGNERNTMKGSFGLGLQNGEKMEG